MLGRRKRGRGVCGIVEDVCKEEDDREWVKCGKKG